MKRLSSASSTALKASPMTDPKDAEVHLRDQEAVLAVDDEVAETGLGADHFGIDQHQHGRGAGQANTDKDGRERSRQDHLAEQLLRGCAHGPCRLDQQRIDLLTAAMVLSNSGQAQL